MHFGIFSPPVTGHIRPFGALGRELIARGHRVSFVQMADAEAKIRAERLEFLPIGAGDHPRGSLQQSLDRLGKLKGLAALRFTIDAVRKTTVMICRDAPGVIRDAGIGMLLVDQTEPAGASVAEYLGLPFVTVCCALALNEDSSLPPPFTSWRYADGVFATARNRSGYRLSRFVMKPVTRALSEFRKQWGLPRHKVQEDSFSKLAQISQQPALFDFPRRTLPECFHYVGPLRRDDGEDTSFPWDRLDGRPLIYASLGTLQHSKTDIFRTFAEACAGLDVQLVLSHGGALNGAAVAALPGDPIAVSWAPQRKLMERCRLGLTHAGLNTVLDALAFGVPLIAIPITYEQPAIARRIEHCGAGRMIRLPQLNAEKLRFMIEEVLNSAQYACGAGRVAESIRRAGGVARAADIIEQVMPASR